MLGFKFFKKILKNPTQLEKHMKAANEDFLGMWYPLPLKDTLPRQKFAVVLMESLTSYLPTLTLCLHTGESTYKNGSMFCITSTAAPHAEYSKSHFLFSTDLSLKAQNLVFGKIAPNLSVHSGE